jgi:plastocyanin
MIPVRRPLMVAAAACLLAAAAPALAGQIRIDVSSNFFSDSTVVANPGDQLVWVWTAGTHSVTSGTAGTSTGDGKFNSLSQSGAGKSFAWKSPGASTGVVHYYCVPHFGFGMHGRINFSASHVPVSEFRISEVRFTLTHDNDYVEIANLGDADGNLGRYRLSVPSGTLLTLGGAGTDIPVPAGGRVVVWLGKSGVNSSTEQFFPGATLGFTGSAALYLPTTKGVDTTRTRNDLMVDYVQWGAGAQLNEATAGTATFWTAGEFVPAVADGHTLEFCGNVLQRGASFWQGSPVPTPGTSNCLTPARTSSWGRIKTLYR